MNKLSDPTPLGRQIPAKTRTPRLALIGCGAFAQVFYLPALAQHPDVLAKLVLVDRDAARTRNLAETYRVAGCYTDFQDVLGAVDGVIIAVPHALHYPIAMCFLEHGVHVLCEKPLALSASEAQAMVDAAEKASVTLGANYTQRLFPSNIRIRELLAKHKFGEVSAITYAWGSEFSWPTVSGFYFNEAGEATRPIGVLADRGAHALDLICWWLGAKPQLVVSQNDSMGGLEAVAHVTLRHADIDIDIRVSWLTELSNTYTIRGTETTVRNPYAAWWELRLEHESGEVEILSLPSTEREYNDFGRHIVTNFIDVIGIGAAPLIPASDVVASIELLEECYAQATPFDLPWYSFEGVLDVD